MVEPEDKNETLVEETEKETKEVKDTEEKA
jgi:hypothetical protein